MEPEADYPAAHSMDTEWYAVDRDGHVALFTSLEAGAVPEAACTEGRVSEVDVSREALAEALPEARYRLLDWLGEGREEQHRELPNRGEPRGLGPTLLFLTSLDAVRTEIDEGDADQAPASEGVAVLFFDLPVVTAWRLHEAGACLGCFAWPSEGGYDLLDQLPRRIGLFHFVHSDETENWIAGPYARGEPPGRPLHLDQLPPDLRVTLGRVRFEAICFTEAERIQPASLVRCVAWGDAYLDIDGRTVRPIPGREGQFDAEDWASHPELRVEMPGPEPPSSPRPGDGPR